MTVHLCRNPAYLLHFCSISRGTARGFPDQRGFLLQPAGTPPYSPTGHGPTAESFSLDCYLGLAPPCCCFLWEIPLTCSKQQRITQQIQWNLTWNVRPHHLHIYGTRTCQILKALHTDKTSQLILRQWHSKALFIQWSRGSQDYQEWKVFPGKCSLQKAATY